MKMSIVFLCFLISIVTVKADFECDKDFMDVICSEDGTKMKEDMLSTVSEECKKIMIPFKKTCDEICAEYLVDKDVKKACKKREPMEESVTKAMDSKECA